MTPRPVAGRVIRRVVLDTSTLVSAALRPDSIPYQALHAALRYCEVCASQETLAELKKVMGRAKFRAYLSDKLRREFVAMVEGHVRLYPVRDEECFADHAACRDPKDNQFLALAYAAEADAVVSSDEDLLVLDPWGEVRILGPAAFLEALQQR
uniref:Putative toxin-antitoxin system toxin component, PIN family n=1 Tax=Acidobacterium capsulatum TaxID=33075 RepID=A0A7V5CT81_9BACT